MFFIINITINYIIMTISNREIHMTSSNLNSSSTSQLQPIEIIKFNVDMKIRREVEIPAGLTHRKTEDINDAYKANLNVNDRVFTQLVNDNQSEITKEVVNLVVAKLYKIGEKEVAEEKNLFFITRIFHKIGQFFKGHGFQTEGEWTKSLAKKLADKWMTSPVETVSVVTPAKVEETARGDSRIARNVEMSKPSEQKAVETASSVTSAKVEETARGDSRIARDMEISKPSEQKAVETAPVVTPANLTADELRSVLIKNGILPSADQAKATFWGLGDEWWKQIIDGSQHQHGKMVFDEGLHKGHIEPGYLAGIEKASRHFTNNFEQPFSLELYSQTHQEACGHFRQNPGDGTQCRGNMVNTFRTEMERCTEELSSEESPFAKEQRLI